MSETWLPGVERQQGPHWKQGYPGIPNRAMEAIEGEVNHSAEGSMAALLAEIQNLTRLASWTFSIDTDGRIVEHYPLEAITWHAGRKGDLDPDTEITGNIALLGKEHAGKVGTPLTALQEDASVSITKFVRATALAGDNPPELAVNLWEHNWINPSTACPSGRINWVTYMAKLSPSEEDDMTAEEHSTLMNSQKQILEILHILKGGQLPSQAGLAYAKSVLGRLEALEDDHHPPEHN